MSRVTVILIAAAALWSCLAPSAAASMDKYQAAATLHTWVFAANGIAARCSKTNPPIAKQVERDLATWKNNDKLAISRAESVWREMQVASPRTAADERADEAQLEKLWLALTTQQLGDPPNHAQSRCAQYFQDRASGLLRSRRPEIFSALESQ